MACFGCKQILQGNQQVTVDATCIARGIAQELESLLEQVKSLLLLRDAEPTGKQNN